MILERERAAYFREKPYLLLGGHAGRWVLVQGDTVVGTFATVEAALTEGYHRYDLEPFMVHEVAEPEKVLFCRPRYCRM